MNTKHILCRYASDIITNKVHLKINNERKKTHDMIGFYGLAFNLSARMY